MKVLAIFRLSAIVLAITGASVAFAAPSDEETAREDQTKVQSGTVQVAKGELTDVILSSRTTLERFTSGSNARISKDKLKAAECVVVFPEVTKAAILVGGKHGDGIATCKGENNADWSQVAFVDMRGASFGTQLGVEKAAVVMLLHSEQAKEKLKSGNLRFTADIGWVLGDQEGRKTVAAGDTDVEVFSDATGAFATASLTGSYVASDDEELERFYEKEISTIHAALSTAPTDNAKEVVRNFLVLLPTEPS